MKAAFDDPPGSANFSQIASSEDLYAGDILHRSTIVVDEQGTEAAGGVTVQVFFNDAPPAPVTVQVDRPFIYAIQALPSGVCLFLGRVMDPRKSMKMTPRLPESKGVDR
jgi:serpin B